VALDQGEVPSDKRSWQCAQHRSVGHTKLKTTSISKEPVNPEELVTIVNQLLKTADRIAS
jgi:hypothetical protein